MRPRVLFAAITIALAFSGTASAQPKPETSVHRLRNVAATDAAQALTTFANQKKLPVAVVAEPVSNTVMVAGDAASVQQMAGLLASLDKQPPSVCVQMQVMETMDGFAEKVGLGAAGETSWALTPREVRMLAAAIRTAKQQKEVEIISEPRIIVADNQTGTVQTGGTPVEARRLGARVTPRIMPDGSVLLNVETDFKRGPEEQTIRVTGKLQDGGTLVMRGANSKSADGGSRETLMIVTVNRIVSERK